MLSIKKYGKITGFDQHKTASFCFIAGKLPERKGDFGIFYGREFEGEEEYLEILGITREQSGKYECKAANEVSSADVKQVKVTVNYPPTITESKSNEATTGRKASLKCEASAVPAPDFEWYRDDTRINSANGLEIKSTEGQSSLTVTNVTEEHYGNYTCVAANNLGMTNASLVLFSDSDLSNWLLLEEEQKSCSSLLNGPPSFCK
ncbi:hypothetical protein JEQ12_001380 [Ovis aries]|uniref:Ig-like domain-containing protein n=1 Tax=Ovis aries TaxID=9940 RepID=A0A836AMU8_SHEEP|nr:hypothetical protein JEQ12_001380 [Ovis aries]